MAAIAGHARAMAPSPAGWAAWRRDGWPALRGSSLRPWQTAKKRRPGRSAQLPHVSTRSSFQIMPTTRDKMLWCVLFRHYPVHGGEKGNFSEQLASVRHCVFSIRGQAVVCYLRRTSDDRGHGHATETQPAIRPGGGRRRGEEGRGREGRRREGGADWAYSGATEHSP